MPTQKYTIRGLRPEDEARVAERIRQERGVLFALFSHSAQCAEVEFEDDVVTPAEIAQVLRELGYTVEIAG